MLCYKHFLMVHQSMRGTMELFYEKCKIRPIHGPCLHSIHFLLSSLKELKENLGYKNNHSKQIYIDNLEDKETSLDC